MKRSGKELIALRAIRQFFLQLSNCAILRLGVKPNRFIAACFIAMSLRAVGVAISFLFLQPAIRNPQPLADEKKAVPTQEKIVEERITTSVNKVLSILKDKNLAKETKKTEVRKVVDPLFDIPLMAKLVIGPKHWQKFSQAQRKEFTELFIKALQDSYFEKVHLLTDEYVEFEKPQPAGNKFQMLTYIIAKDKRYAMIFKLYQKKSAEEADWLVYDVEIEGISFVRSFSNQYDQFLKKNSPKELLARLREKSLELPEELKSKKKEETAKESKGSISP